MPPRFPLVALIAGFLIAIGALSRADPPQPTRSPDAGGAAAFRLVIWYDRSRPFETFRHRAYDLGKGEYTTAVLDWMVLMDRSYPGYTVLVRDVAVTEGDPADQVSAVVADEKLALAKIIMQAHGYGSPERGSEYRSGYRGFSWSPQTTAPSRNPSAFKNGIPGSFSPLGAAHTVPSPTYLFPNPMPYPRPHP